MRSELLGYGRVPGLSSKRTTGSAAAGRSISITRPEEVLEEGARGWNRSVGMVPPKMVKVAVVVRHTHD
jgi:hypothetical protein